MPEYAPQISLPSGLAETLMAERARRQTPFAQLAGSIGGGLSDVISAYAKHKAETLDPKQAEAISAYVKNQFGPQQTPNLMGSQNPLTIGQNSPPSLPTNMNPAAREFLGQQMSLGERMAAAKEATARAQSVAGMRGEQAKTLEDLKYRHKQELEAWKSAHPSESKTRSTDLQEEKMWEQANRVVNPNSAPRGSLLGTAGLLNARADRALETLKDPKITPQQIQMVVTDIAGIMHGGSPDEVEIKSQNYGTYWTSFESLLGKIQNKPKEAGSPETVKTLTSIVKGLKQIDNKIIKNNLDIVENSHSGLFKKDPERWKKIKEQVMKTTQGVTEQDAGKYDDIINKHFGGPNAGSQP